MKTTTADVIIVGSGVSGALLASELMKQKLKVVILEAGKKVDRTQSMGKFFDAAIKIPECPYEESPCAPFPKTIDDNYFSQAGPLPFKSTYLRVTGGTTWHWLGTCLRLLPDDFHMHTKFKVGVDWPISYKDLEVWYGKAEQELGVAGNSTQDLGSPRKKNYPLPEIPFSELDSFVQEGLKDLNYTLTHTPQARNSIPFDGRSACCKSASCVPICPIQAKYDATVHINKAISQGAVLIENAVVFKLETNNETGAISSVLFKRPDGSIEQAQGKTYILAANAIESAKILLMSKSEKFKNGIANKSDQVGRNLMDHPVILSYALAPERIYPYQNPLSTSGCEAFRNGSFRSKHAAYRLEVHNDGWNFPTGGINPLATKLINQGLTGYELKNKYRNMVARQVSFAALIEQLPQPHNRIEPDYERLDAIGIPKPKIAYSFEAYEEKTFQESQNKMRELLKHLNCSEIQTIDSYFGAGHILGTHRMGNNPKTSVTDKNLQSHEHKNLYLVGGGSMPTEGTSNPTLTIAALALRCANHISTTHA